MQKQSLPLVLIAASIAILISSCTTPGTSLQPRADVEAIERQDSTTPTPNVGQHEAGRNAVDYANDRRRRYGYGYGGYYGY